MELEPYPPEEGQEWEKGCPQWIERYEYIQARAERYFDQYRDSVEYDFTKTGTSVEAQQKALEIGYERFASGSLKLLGVQALAKMLRDAYRRKEATPLTPDERAALIRHRSSPPRWELEWREKKERERREAHARMLAAQPSPDRLRLIAERAYYGELESSPMPGKWCYSLTADQGFSPEGEKTDKALAYCQVHWDRYEREHPDRRRPEILRPKEQTACQLTPEVNGGRA